MLYNEFNTHHFEWILKAEGGHTSHKDDKGGETKYGISHNAYPALDIASLSIEDAGEIYKVDYYDAYRLGELPPRIGLMTFDGLVNHNPKTAIRILQRAVGARGDGIIGGKTIAAAQRASEYDTIEKMAAGRLDLYEAIVKANSTQAVFINGWRNRVIRLIRFIDGPFSTALLMSE